MRRRRIRVRTHLTCNSTVSPIHGTQDVSVTPFVHSPFTHPFLLLDTVRRSACTSFVQTCPNTELVLMFCFTMWQFVNAGPSYGSHPSRHGLLRFQERDVIHDRAVPTVQTTNLPGNWQYSRCLAYVLCIPLHLKPLECPLS